MSHRKEGEPHKGWKDSARKKLKPRERETPKLNADEYQCKGCGMIWKIGTSHPCLPIRPLKR